MKDILGHKSWTQEEIIDMLRKTGQYTCPTLPHYRYNRVKTICRNLQKRGFLKRSGKTSVSVNLIITDRFKEWSKEYDEGKTTSMPIKWQKSKYPILK